MTWSSSDSGLLRFTPILPLHNPVNGDTRKPESEEEQVIADMEEDDDMLENAGISSQRSFNESGTGQQCLVEATIKETLSAIPGNKRADIKVFVINKMSGNINL